MADEEQVESQEDPSSSNRASRKADAQVLEAPSSSKAQNKADPSGDLGSSKATRKTGESSKKVRFSWDNRLLTRPHSLNSFCYLAEVCNR